MELTSENLYAVLRDCLFTDEVPEEEIEKRAVKVPGIIATFGFDPAKLEAHREDITSMLLQLPDNFRQTKGGGWTFLNACDRADGVQWTGEHRRMDALFVLGMAIGKVKCLLPQAMWHLLPGGMPYYVVLDAPAEGAPAAKEGAA